MENQRTKLQELLANKYIRVLYDAITDVAANTHRPLIGEKEKTLEFVFNNMELLGRESQSYGITSVHLPLSYKKMYLYLLSPENFCEYDMQIAPNGMRTCECRLYLNKDCDLSRPDGVGFYKEHPSLVDSNQFKQEIERDKAIDAIVRGQALTRAITDAGIGLEFFGDANENSTLEAGLFQGKELVEPAAEPFSIKDVENGMNKTNVVDTTQPQSEEKPKTGAKRGRKPKAEKEAEEKMKQAVAETKSEPVVEETMVEKLPETTTSDDMCPLFNVAEETATITDTTQELNTVSEMNTVEEVTEEVKVSEETTTTVENEADNMVENIMETAEPTETEIFEETSIVDDVEETTLPDFMKSDFQSPNAEMTLEQAYQLKPDVGAATKYATLAEAKKHSNASIVWMYMHGSKHQEALKMIIDSDPTLKQKYEDALEVQLAGE